MITGYKINAHENVDISFSQTTQPDEAAVLPLKTEEDVVRLRKDVKAALVSRGFSLIEQTKMITAASELARNTLRYGGGGEARFVWVTNGARLGLSLSFIAQGPRIENVDLALTDGYTSGSGLGLGLGGAKRLSDTFEIDSVPGDTVLPDTDWRPGLSWETGAICVAYPGEDICGDAWGVNLENNLLTFMVADGLGHGPDAALASNTAITILDDCHGQSPAELLQRTPIALQQTRGAAVGIGQIDMERGQLRFAGVGNIAASVFEVAAKRHLVSHNGIVGSNLRKVQEFSQPWESGATLIAHSDGLATRWDLDSYPGLAASHPGVIAAVLYRDFTRGRDDVSVLVPRHIR